MLRDAKSTFFWSDISFPGLEVVRFGQSKVKVGNGGRELLSRPAAVVRHPTGLPG